MSKSVCINESQSSSTMPYSRITSSRPYLGPLAGTLTLTRTGDLEIPYLSLRKLKIQHQQRYSQLCHAHLFGHLRTKPKPSLECRVAI
ncbi:hypothetical protein E1A91_A11G286900v1 [Gossypium mustelinum]|uniref:Uncharacterized protein n=1 Tax=Gossypium mustelinum TaxID=34275 RepID=A0A5D2XCQ6_GOSMU|nr:hypothetical protein E1A91_A11G286900v1 [Gossypium mustelinum]